MKTKVMLKAKNPQTLKSDWITFVVDSEKLAELEKYNKLDDGEYLLADIELCKEGRKGLFSINQAKRADRFLDSVYNNLGIFKLSLHIL